MSMSYRTVDRKFKVAELAAKLPEIPEAERIQRNRTLYPTTLIRKNGENLLKLPLTVPLGIIRGIGYKPVIWLGSNP
jgi:hypothetical protein